MSPILIRPVREQLEHDRIIRLLPTRYRRKFEVGINPGAEQNAAVGTGPKAVYPDGVLYSTDRVRKVQGVIEVETGESINHLEAMSQWANYGRLNVPFHLYVPSNTIDVARRLSSDHQVLVAELWSYDNIGDQVRFTLVQRAPDAPALRVDGAAKATPRPAAPRPAARTEKAAKPAAAKAASKARPAAKAAPTRATARPAARVARPASRPRPNGRATAPVARTAGAGRTQATARAAKPAAKRAGGSAKTAKAASGHKRR